MAGASTFAHAAKALVGRDPLRHGSSFGRNFCGSGSLFLAVSHAVASGWDDFEMELYPSVDHIPGEAVKRFAVARKGDGLHFRFFDGSGKIILDAEDANLPGQDSAGLVRDIKSQLGGLQAAGPKEHLVQQLWQLLHADLSEGLKLENNIAEPVHGDPTVQFRWAAISAIARSLSKKEFDKALEIAKVNFDRVIGRLGLGLQLGDAKPGTEDDELFRKVQEVLGGNWTPTCWMVWDALSQLNDNDGHRPPRECTWLLYAPTTGDGEEGGAAFRIVVEAVPGPAIVVPNWWQLGLLPFPIGEKRTPFVPAIQEALSWVLRNQPNQRRIRWHLVPPQPGAGTGNWWEGLSGPSGMAAATWAARALFRKLDPNQDGKDDCLEENTAVTAAMKDGRFLAVDGLPAKFAAARRTKKIDRIFLANDQTPPPNPGIAIDRAEDIVRFEERVSLEDIFDNYRKGRQLHFDYRPREEPKTPGDAS